MKNGHSRKKSYLPHRGNWQLSPLLSPSDISIEFTYYITKQYLLCSSLDSRNVFGGGGGGSVESSSPDSSPSKSSTISSSVSKNPIIFMYEMLRKVLGAFSPSLMFFKSSNLNRNLTIYSTATRRQRHKTKSKLNRNE